LSDDSHEIFDGSTKVVDKIAGGAGSRNNGASRHTDVRETQARQESSHFRAELNEQALSVGTSDFKDVTDFGS
jgi:hypothetical protein